MRYDPSQRLAGLLAPVFALRRQGDLGIGDTLAVCDAIDFCAQTGFGMLQLLPIHETVGDHSPYNAISSRALSPSLLTLTPELVPGLSEDILEAHAPSSWRAQLCEGRVKHGIVHALKLKILLAAYDGFIEEHDAGASAEFRRFCSASESWLTDYTLFRLLTREYEGNPNWTDWRPEHQDRDGARAWLGTQPNRAELERQLDALAYIQWVAARQWRSVREHADAASVLLMGEMSFGVGKCSADVWANRELFDIDWNLGTRPIVYFDTNKDSERWGQNWGLPPYNWDAHRATGFRWLRERIEANAQYFHLCRLDHLRGYFRVYMFPWNGGAEHAAFAKLTEEEALQRTGGRAPRFVPGADEDPHWAAVNEAQGRELIGLLQHAAGDMYLVAEIMGEMPEYMARTLDDLHVANLTFPQLERGPDRALKPLHGFRRLSLATYANHDHAPLAAFYQHLYEMAQKEPEGFAPVDLRNLLAFANVEGTPPPELTEEVWEGLIESLFTTPCILAVVMTSDLLAIHQRFNLPGSYGPDTWSERLERPLTECRNLPEWRSRIDRVSELIRKSGRSLDNRVRRANDEVERPDPCHHQACSP